MNEMILALVGCSGLWAVVMEVVRAVANRKSGINKTLTEVSERLVKLEEAQEQDRATAARTRIVRFNDELLNNVRHSKSMYDSVLIDCSNYEKYCDKHKDFKNGIAQMAIENIKRCYLECEEKHDFI